MTLHIHGGDVYRYENYLDFSANCNPLGLPRGVKEAMIQAIDGVVHYPDVRCEKLKEAIGAYEEVPVERIVCGNGAAEVIFSLCLARKPKKALLLAPTFAEYEQALESVDCSLVYYGLSEESGYSIQEDIFRKLREEKPDMMFLCNPNNPTGVLTEREYLEEILGICEAQGTLLVVDECFLDFVEEPERYTMKKYLNSPSLFLVKAFTKRYAMAGVRLGYGLSGSQALLERMNAVTQPWNVSGLAQAAGAAALQEREYVEAGRQLIFQEREYLKKELEKLGLTIYGSQANYIFFYGGKNLPDQMKEYRILIRDCGNYHGLEPGYCRIAVRTHEENQCLVQALGKILNRKNDSERREHNG